MPRPNIPNVPPFRPFVPHMVLPAVYDDELSYMELLGKVERWLTDVVDATTAQTEAVVALYAAWKEFSEGGYTDSFEEFLDQWFADNQEHIDELLMGQFADELAQVQAASDAAVQAANSKVFKPEAPLSVDGTSGQVLSTLGNGKTEWVDPIVPTDAQADRFISKWLDEHPEATTTVQDGSITTVKLADGAVTNEKISSALASLNAYDLMALPMTGEGEARGVAYTWSNGTLTLNGVSNSQGALGYIYNNIRAMPTWLTEGNTLYITMDKSVPNKNVFLSVNIFTATGSQRVLFTAFEDEHTSSVLKYTVPNLGEYTAGARVSIYCRAGAQIDMSLTVEFLNAKSNAALSLECDVLDERVTNLESALPPDETPVIIKIDGTGDYTSIRQAFESEGARTYWIYEGTYNVETYFTDEEISSSYYDSAGSGFVGIRVPDGAKIYGIGRKTHTIIRCTLNPNDYTYTVRANIATLNLMGNAHLENLTIEAIYARTPIHDDFAANMNAVHYIKNCVLRNTIYERRTSHGYGLGLLSGQHVTIDGCYIYPSMVCHTNTNFSAPAKLTLINTTIANQLSLQNLNSGLATEVNIIASRFNTCVYTDVSNTQWMVVNICDSKGCFAQLNECNVVDARLLSCETEVEVSKGQLLTLLWPENDQSRQVPKLRPTNDISIACGYAIEDADASTQCHYIGLHDTVATNAVGILEPQVGMPIGIDSDGMLVNSGYVTRVGSISQVIYATGIGVIRLD